MLPPHSPFWNTDGIVVCHQIQDHRLDTFGAGDHCRLKQDWAHFFSENFGEIVTHSLNLYTFLFIKHFSMEIRREISATLENLPNPGLKATSACLLSRDVTTTSNDTDRSLPSNPAWAYMMRSSS